MTTFTREDFEHAARAAGYDGINFNAPFSDALGYPAPGHQRGWWHPVADDGDALRLAVALHMDFTLSGRHAAVAQAGPYFKQEFCNGDPNAAARHAIFRAAIAIGKAMLAPDTRPTAESSGVAPSETTPEHQTPTLFRVWTCPVCGVEGRSRVCLTPSCRAGICPVTGERD